MVGIISKVFVVGVLGWLTFIGYEGCFQGMFLPKPLEKPVSLREGSRRPGGGALLGYYFIGSGRRHFGGGYRGGK